MNEFNANLAIIMERLKEHRRKKQEFLDSDAGTEVNRADANGRIIALDHALSELESLYFTGEVKESLK